MSKRLTEQPGKIKGNSFFRELVNLPPKVQDKVIEKLGPGDIEKIIEKILVYGDKNKKRVFQFACLLLLVAVFVFAALWLADRSQQAFIWVSIGLLILALVVLEAKDLIRKYLPPRD